MNKELTIFRAALANVANKVYKKSVGGLNHQDADLFIESSYHDYLSSQLPVPHIDWIDRVPTNVSSWIKEYLKNKFSCMIDMPQWVGEPGWRFIEGRPMVFIKQIEFCENEIMNSHVSSGDVIYIFSGRKEVAGGWELVIKMIKQSTNSIGTAYVF